MGLTLWESSINDVMEFSLQWKRSFSFGVAHKWQHEIADIFLPFRPIVKRHKIINPFLPPKTVTPFK